MNHVGSRARYSNVKMFLRNVWFTFSGIYIAIYRKIKHSCGPVVTELNVVQLSGQVGHCCSGTLWRRLGM